MRLHGFPYQRPFKPSKFFLDPLTGLVWENGIFKRSFKFRAKLAKIPLQANFFSTGINFALHFFLFGTVYDRSSFDRLGDTPPFFKNSIAFESLDTGGGSSFAAKIRNSVFLSVSFCFRLYISW